MVVVCLGVFGFPPAQPIETTHFMFPDPQIFFKVGLKLAHKKRVRIVDRDILVRVQKSEDDDAT